MEVPIESAVTQAEELDETQQLAEVKTKSERIALVWGFASGIGFGIVNTLGARLSARSGVIWSFAIVFYPIPQSLVYHVAMHIRGKQKAIKEGTKPPKFFSRNSSAYFKEDGKLNWANIGFPVRRALINIWINIILSITFQFTFLAGLNPGIVSTLFITSLIWIVLYFFLKHKQRLLKQELLGVVIMILAVCLISLSKQILGNEAEVEASAVSIEG